MTGARDGEPVPSSVTAAPQEMGAPARPLAGAGTLIALGVGWLGTQVFWAFNTGTMPLFLKGYTDSKFSISLVLSLAGVSGCVVGPVIGYLSDRTVSRFGRRRPYIVSGMLGAALLLLALSHAETFAAVVALAVVMYGAINIAQAPYLSLLPDVTPSHQRSTASGVMNLVGSLGLIAYFAGSAVLWERHPSVVFVLVALVLVGAMLVPVTLVREPAAVPSPSGSGFRAHLRSLRRERPLLTYFAASSCCWLGHWIAVTFFTLFVVEELGVAEGSSQYVPLVFGLSATVATLPLGMLGDRVGRKRLLCWLVAAWLVVAIATAFIQTLPQALLAAALTAIPFAGLMAVGYALMLDLIPPQRTAEFVGLSFIPGAVPQIIGPLLGGLLIDTLGYRAIFPAAACAQLLGLIILRSVSSPPREPAA
ncbi:MAG: MFS transporter [Deltaproteobacteria bacterium]|nr:MFS transporter [Deltaproteobacteria bacterium]